MRLNIKAPLNTFLGYGHAALNLIKELDKQGIAVSLFPIGGVQLTTNDGELIQRLFNNRINSFDVDMPSLTIFHEFAFFDALQSKKEVVGFPFFELDQMNLMRIRSLSCLDLLLVSSEWAKQTVLPFFHGPIDVVNLGVDPTIFGPPRPRNDKVYKFFTIGKIEKRKCTELLPRIFESAFLPEDNVEFHVMCDSPIPQIRQQMPRIRDMFKNSKLGNKIILHPMKNTDYELADFIRSMDCGIFMTRAEGWGLPILQSLACGKHVITTDYSAQTEFCNSKNSMLVNITKKEVAEDGVWFGGDCGNWASIEEEQLQQCIEYMRHAYKNRLVDNKEGVLTGQKFTWEASVKALLNALR